MALENIVLEDRSSILVRVIDEDPAYVVGYYADVRDQVVNTELRKIDKGVIALRIQFPEERRPHPDELTYSHRKADYS